MAKTERIRADDPEFLKEVESLAERKERYWRLAETPQNLRKADLAFQKAYKAHFRTSKLPNFLKNKKHRERYFRSLTSVNFFLLVLRDSVHLPGWPKPGARNRLTELLRDYFSTIIPDQKAMFERIRHQGAGWASINANSIAAPLGGHNRTIFSAFVQERCDFFSPGSYWYNEDPVELERQIEENLRRTRESDARYDAISKMTNKIEAAAAIAYEDGFEGDPLKNVYGGDIFVDEVPLEHFIKGEDGCLIHPKPTER